ncbi:MAG: LacI family DNA-binding transcriptional regulator [Actinobacteria bacterium]|nr:LacI family DNA-binding transcriptional regulator [Actinomycetota bacterium]
MPSYEARPPIGLPGTAARRATIDDVARAAGVSRQTVSNVVRGRGRLASATRDRVVAAIDALSYRPHTGAASLRSGRTYRIAYPIPDDEFLPDNVIMLEFLQFMVAAARAREQQVLVTTSSTSDLASIHELAWTRSVDGFVLASVAANDPRIAYLAARQVPFACFGRVAPSLPQNWVDIDNRAALRTMTRHVLASGHTSVSYLGYDPQGPWDELREAGYRDAVSAAGLPARVTRTGLATATVSTVVTELLTGPDRPTAVVTGSDVLAAACYSAASRAGLRIGPDLAVTGFDGSVISRMLSPALATMAMPLRALANRLIDLVIAQVNGTAAGCGELLETILIPGGSVQPPSGPAA